jgi:hypothetical protein
VDVDKLLKRLNSDSPAARREAMADLLSLAPETLIGPTADFLLAAESPDLCADCLDILDRCEASASLAEVRMNGWFLEIMGRVNNLADIIAVMGERLLAYSFILNIQIRSLMVDPMSPLNTAVHFMINDEQIQALSLGEFRLRVIQALLHENKLPVIPTLPFATDTAVAVLGGRTLLIAPLFDITLDRVIAASLDPLKPRFLVTFIFEDKFFIEELQEFNERIRAGLRRDLAGIAGQPFTLDLFAVQRAKEAADVGDHTLVIETLEAWPGLLSVLHRTAAAKNLDDKQLALIAEGVLLLGSALEKEGRAIWSEELYRLGLQFVRETKEAARLMANLGRLLVAKAAFGESIGLLRRALSLGEPEDEILPLLGRSFLKQEKWTAARALLERCETKGYAGENLASDLAQARLLFEEKGIAWAVPSQDVEPPP